MDADLALPQPGAENEPEDKPKAGEADECDEAFDPDDLPVLLVDVSLRCARSSLSDQSPEFGGAVSLRDPSARL